MRNQLIGRLASLLLSGAALPIATPVIAQSETAPPECGTAPVSGQRVAIIIGNDNYANRRWPQLVNAGRDAGQICDALRSIGISVQVIRNADARTMQAQLQAFAQSAANARVVIVYFAGHGFEFAGRNYMVPVDAPASTRIDTVERDFVSLEVLALSAIPANAVGIFFIDACRTAEPVVRLDEGVTAVPTLPVSALSIDQGAVFYSTARGRPALDQAPPGSPVSPFAAALVTHLSIPGIELAQMFRNVTRDVVATTRGLENGPQWPQQQVNLLDSVYLAESLDASRSSSSRSTQLSRFLGVSAASSAATRLRNGVLFRGGFRNRGLAEPLELPTMARLSVVDEPAIIADLLKDHSPLDVLNRAEAGDAAAQHLVGYMYAFGVGLTRNGPAALEWLERSAAANYAPGQLELGYFLLEYRPTQTELLAGSATMRPAPRAEEFARAEQLYRAAAASGYAKAKTHLAERIVSGQFGPPNMAEVERLYREAADAGHGAAIFALTRTPALRAEMIVRLRAMAADGDIEGHNWLCEAAYDAGSISVAVDDCDMAAVAGYAGARAILARAYADGAGVMANRATALHWARMARGQPELGERARMIADIR
jgi:uncharacterized protein